MKTLLLLLMSIIALGAFAKEGGNGQLVVIPSGGKDPVPYEVAKSWDSGVYRNFYKLPYVNGNVESRSKFNRDYGIHALAWMEILKDYSPNLYEKLNTAAKVTTFRILNNFILWKEESYPEGEVDYKKYEKAAFFNGEIILSTVVMDRVGKLEDVLTKEENQGFIVIHELINAAYPDMPIKDKLVLGELIANIKILNWSKAEFLAEAMNRKFFFVLAKTNFETSMDAARVLGQELMTKIGFTTSIEDLELIHTKLAKDNFSKDALSGLFQSLYSNDQTSTFRKFHNTLSELSKLNGLSGKELNELLTNEVLDTIDYAIVWNRLLDLPGTHNRIAFKRIQILKDSYNHSLSNEAQDTDYAFNKIASLYYFLNYTEHNFKRATFEDYKRYVYTSSNADAEWNSDVKNLNLVNKLQNALQIGFDRSLSFLKIKSFFVDGAILPNYISFSGSMKITLTKRQKIRFIKNHLKDKCALSAVGLSFDENYNVKSAGDKVKLVVIDANNPDRNGMKFSVNFDAISSCSIAEMY